MLPAGGIRASQGTFSSICQTLFSESSNFFKLHDICTRNSQPGPTLSVVPELHITVGTLQVKHK